VIYGHLDKDGLIANGTVVEAGDILGNLAPAKSEWSGGNRKHLHLGIRKGETSDYRGYVQTEEELKEYIDPRTVLGTFSAGKDTEKFTVEQ
jgi:DNA-directed RNA polymerase beta subunit